MVQNKLTRETLLERADELSFPSSVVEFMQASTYIHTSCSCFVNVVLYFQGQIGQPPYGFPEPLRTKILRGKPKMDGRPGEQLAPLDFDKKKEELEEKHGRTLR